MDNLSPQQIGHMLESVKSEARWIIVSALNDNPNVTAPELAEIVSMKLDKVKIHIASLRKYGAIVFRTERGESRNQRYSLDERFRAAIIEACEQTKRIVTSK